MTGDDSRRDPVRDEAERLVAAAIGTLSMAARGLGGHHSSGRFATGGDECCVCPICRVIAAMREPDPDLADRLATGAGDVATAVAGMLRSVSRPRPPADASDWTGPASGSEPEDPWRAATAPSASTSPASPRPPAKPMAKKATKKAAPAPVQPEARDEPPPPAKKAAKAAKKAAAKKVAKKAVKRAPGDSE